MHCGLKGSHYDIKRRCMQPMKILW